MTASWFEQFKEVCERHGMNQESPRKMTCVQFGKAGVVVESCNRGETYEVMHAGTTRVSPSLGDLDGYLYEIGH